jgi:4-hydroxybenzoate polyprenyltransferase/phosphoserine phosphatase
MERTDHQLLRNKGAVSLAKSPGTEAPSPVPKGGADPASAVETELDSRAVPLVVDLDGTLVLTDTLFESAIALIKQKPWAVIWLAAWLLRGRAFLKMKVASQIELSAETLPYHPELLAYLQTERGTGRTIILATAAHQSIANAVGTKTGLFDEVIGSSASVNLKGSRKCAALVEKFGLRRFDYIGDSSEDTPVWAASRIAHVAGSRTRVPSSALAAGAKQGRVFAGPMPTLRSWMRAVRVHQWVKNVLLFVPTLAAHKLDREVITTLVITFFGFSFLASGTYIVNDLFDLAADRKHPRKSKRPFASGEFSIARGVLLAFVLIAAGFALGAAVGLDLVLCLVAYLALTLTYSTFLKNKPIIDVVALALLYTLRVYTGGIVSGSNISPWLFQFSIFLFLSLAFVKRYSELRRLRTERKLDAPGRGYGRSDLSIISQAGLGSGLLAGLVLALYINGSEIQRLYPRPHMLWIICPLFTYWITRVWLIAHRGNMNEDPVIYAFHDKVSYIVGGVILGAAILGMAPSAP